jgi:quinol-cytochrome oxidoreductase complex cytochrome b subunit
MEKKEGFRIHSFILFLIAVASGGYVVYLQVLVKSDDISSKLIALFVFMVAMYFATKNWVKDNPEKNKKNWSGMDEE